jgi:hypothetical protein
MITAAEYLHKINPCRYVPGRRFKAPADSAVRAFEAAKAVLTIAAESDYVRVVAATVSAAQRHGTSFRRVWRHVKRWRALRQPAAEQLELPLD